MLKRDRKSEIFESVTGFSLGFLLVYRSSAAKNPATVSAASILIVGLVQELWFYILKLIYKIN